MSATILVAGYETAIRRRRVSDRPLLDRPWEVEGYCGIRIALFDAVRLGLEKHR